MNGTTAARTSVTHRNTFLIRYSYDNGKVPQSASRD